MCRHPNAKTENVPIEAARPTQTVETSGRTLRIVSNTAIPAVTDPPGEFTYIVMSWSVREHCEIGLIVEKICHHLLGSVASSQSSCATMRLQLSSSTAPPRQIMRCSHCGSCEDLCSKHICERCCIPDSSADLRRLGSAPWRQGRDHYFAEQQNGSWKVQQLVHLRLWLSRLRFLCQDAWRVTLSVRDTW